MNRTVSALKCAIQASIFMLGIGSCLAYQGINNLYSEAKACEAVQCESIQDMKTAIKDVPPPALK